MEAGYRLRFILIAACTLLMLSTTTVDAANFRTKNFLVQAPNAQLAQAVGKSAEKYRTDLAIHWLGKPLPAWPRPCPIRVVAGQLAAQGVTTYSLKPVRDFQMEVIGTPERILDSVLPHEITHTILATHFGRPLPRWADEGICTTVEHISERSKHEAKLREFLSSRRGIAMNQLFLLTDYPSDVLPMYAQGYSVCRFLIEQKGAPTFINFLHDYMDEGSWTANVKKYYGYRSLRELQEYWLAWVSQGSGPVEKFVMATPNRNNLNPENPSRLAHADGKPITGALASTLTSTPDFRPTDSTKETKLGWYTRKRLEARNTLTSTTAGNARSASPNTITPILPPSVRESGRYRVSQPQEEQQMSRPMPFQATSVQPTPVATKPFSRANASGRVNASGHSNGLGRVNASGWPNAAAHPNTPAARSPAAHNPAARSPAARSPAASSPVYLFMQGTDRRFR